VRLSDEIGFICDGNTCAVYESEHLFGYDVIRAFKRKEVLVPLAIISGHRQMRPDEILIASAVVHWYDSENYGIAMRKWQDLGESLAR
jgi:hypothetical protein